jgi:hypothetical protein
LIRITEKFMSHGPHRFRESEGRRLVKVAQSAGIEIGRLEVGPDGRIAIIPKGAEAPAQSEPPNEWDEVSTHGAISEIR